ncbi:MAG: nitrate/nitrite transporter NrtS [Cyanobacteria bacterium P01_F01_bin.53]
MSQIYRMRQTVAQHRCRVTAIRVALFVGTLLFSINHGSALIDGDMSRDRWLSGLLTYLVPFTVSIHGQSSRRTA